MKITKESIAKAEQVLIDNGIEADKAAKVLNAVGDALFDAALYDATGNTLEEGFRSITRWANEDVFDCADPDENVDQKMVEHWWEHHGRDFHETLTLVGDEMLSNIDWEAVRREMEESNA